MCHARKLQYGSRSEGSRPFTYRDGALVRTEHGYMILGTVLGHDNMNIE